MSRITSSISVPETELAADIEALRQAVNAIEEVPGWLREYRATVGTSRRVISEDTEIGEGRLAAIEKRDATPTTEEAHAILSWIINDAREQDFLV